MLGCPSINTETLSVKIDKSPVVFGEKKKSFDLIKRLTRETIKDGENYLKKEKANVKSLAEAQLKKFFMGMSDLFSRNITEDDIDIVILSPVSPGPFEDSDIENKLKLYGCV